MWFVQRLSDVAVCVLALLQTAAIEEEMRQNPATAAILIALHGSRTTARERQTGAPTRLQD